jgi:hypothetical protein
MTASEFETKTRTAAMTALNAMERAGHRGEEMAVAGLWIAASAASALKWGRFSFARSAWRLYRNAETRRQAQIKAKETTK